MKADIKDRPKFETHTDKTLYTPWGSRVPPECWWMYDQPARPWHKNGVTYLKYKGRMVEIDADIAFLITQVWRLGINTTICCQNTSDCKIARGEKGDEVPSSIIGFATEKDALKYISVIEAGAENELSSRVMLLDSGCKENWMYSTRPSREEDGKVCFSMTISFPRCDLEIVESILESVELE